MKKRESFVYIRLLFYKYYTLIFKIRLHILHHQLDSDAGGLQELNIKPIFSPTLRNKYVDKIDNDAVASCYFIKMAKIARVLYIILKFYFKSSYSHLGKHYSCYAVYIAAPVLFSSSMVTTFMRHGMEYNTQYVLLWHIIGCVEKLAKFIGFPQLFSDRVVCVVYCV